MEKVSKKEVTEMCKELEDALIENLSLEADMINVADLLRKSHTRLQQIKEKVHFIKII